LLPRPSRDCSPGIRRHERKNGLRRREEKTTETRGSGQLSARAPTEGAEPKRPPTASLSPCEIATGTRLGAQVQPLEDASVVMTTKPLKLAAEAVDRRCHGPSLLLAPARCLQ